MPDDPTPPPLPRPVIPIDEPAGAATGVGGDAVSPLANETTPEAASSPPADEPATTYPPPQQPTYPPPATYPPAPAYPPPAYPPPAAYSTDAPTAPYPQ